MNPSDVLEFAAQVFSACQPAKKVRGRAPAGFMKDRYISGSKWLIPILIDYANAGQTLKIGTKTVLSIPKQPVVTSNGLSVELKSSLSATPSVFPISFPSKELQTVCNGEWTAFGNINVKLDPKKLLPKIEAQSDSSALIKWESPPALWYKGSLFSSWKFTLQAIEINSQEGYFRIGGLPDWIFPTLIWA